MSSVSTLPIIKNVSDRSTDYYGWLGTSGIFCCFKMCYAQIIKVCNFTSYFKLTPLMLLDSMTCRSHFHWTAFYYVLDSRNITLLDFNLFCLANVSAWQWLSWSYSKPVTWYHEILTFLARSQRADPGLHSAFPFPTTTTFVLIQAESPFIHFHFNLSKLAPLRDDIGH